MANLSLKIPWQLKSEIERTARQEKASMNRLCIKAIKDYITRSSQEKLIRYSGIEEIVDKRIKRMEDRLAALLVKGDIASLMTKNLMSWLILELMKEHYSPEQARKVRDDIKDAAKKKAIEEIRRK